jgi:hypothetical protein
MTYEELMSLVGGGNPQSASYQDIISGIQSQYRPQTQFAPTTSLLDTLGEQLPEQRGVAYGALLQAQGPRTITPIDLSKYTTALDSTGLSGFDLGGVGGDSGASSSIGGTGFTINENGVAVPSVVNMGFAVALSIATGMPIAKAAQVINSQNAAAAAAANAAIAAADADSIATTGATATAGVGGTGGAAAAAGTAAAAAATASGASPAAAAAAGQAAADAVVSGATASEAAAAGAAAVAAVGLSDSAISLGIDDSSISDGVTDGGGGGDSGTAGVGVGEFANGGLVTMNRLMGSNPMGQDDGYASLQSGEYVIKKNAVDKYGEDFLGLLNSGKLTKKQINSLL